MLGCTEFLDYLGPSLSIIQRYLNENTDPIVANHVMEMISYSLKGGKNHRGFLASSVFLELTKADPKSHEAKIGYTIGWAIEIIQAALLIADDLMDRSETRRGKQCWYLKEGVGDSAVNDALIFENMAFALLATLKDLLPLQRYHSMVMEFRSIIARTTMGQTCDTSAKNPSFQLYSQIVSFKTSLYSFYLPVFASIIASGVPVESLGKELKSALMEIGFYFQAQDDWLDVYGDPKKTGKIGSDISDGKVTWIICKFLEVASEQQKEAFNQCFRSKDPEKLAEARQLLNEVGIDGMFKDFAREEARKIDNMIAQMDPKCPTASIRAIWSTIAGRDR